jgi:hypothetical protein
MSFLAPSKTDIRRRRLIAGGLAVLLTTIVMTGFLLESRWGYSPPDIKLVFMQSWRADRSRADTLADTKATTAAQQAKLAESRAYIATLSGEARKKAQEQYDKYVEGGGAQKDIPYIPAAPAMAGALVTAPAEPPIQ